MAFDVITNPSYAAKMGFTQAQFRKLDDLYTRSASEKVLNYRTVECDFDKETASYTYYKAHGEAPYLQFLIIKIGPKDMMYEVYKQGGGRIGKSGVFERAYEILRAEIEKLSS